LLHRTGRESTGPFVVDLDSQDGRGCGLSLWRNLSDYGAKVAHQQLG
jgi:hypothetical protein